MSIINQPPRKKELKKTTDYDKKQERELGLSGGDDSLTNASPDDSRADEKVIVNEQQEDKVVNAPSSDPKPL